VPPRVLVALMASFCLRRRREGDSSSVLLLRGEAEGMEGEREGRWRVETIFGVVVVVVVVIR
jgi:hypothetical protein